MSANSVDPGQMPQNAASDLGLHCLLRPVYSGLSVITVALKVLSKIVADDILNIFLLLLRESETFYVQTIHSWVACYGSYFL